MDDTIKFSGLYQSVKIPSEETSTRNGTSVMLQNKWWIDSKTEWLGFSLWIHSSNLYLLFSSGPIRQWIKSLHTPNKYCSINLARSERRSSERSSPINLSPPRSSIWLYGGKSEMTHFWSLMSSLARVSKSSQYWSATEYRNRRLRNKPFSPMLWNFSFIPKLLGILQILQSPVSVCSISVFLFLSFNGVKFYI